MRQTPRPVKPKSGVDWNKKWVAVCVAGGVLLLALCLVLWQISRPASAELGSVNGAPFYKEELEMYTEGRRAAVAAEFSARYNLNSLGESFWRTEYEGVTPGEVLTEKALEDLVRSKIIQQEAVRRGVAAPLDFREMQRALEAENNARGSAASGTYGPGSYALREYSSYLMSRAEDDLKTALLEEEAPSDAQMRKAFDTLPETLRQEHFNAEGLVFTCEDEAEDLQGRLQTAIEAGQTPQQAADALADEVPGLVFEPFVMQSIEVHREDISALALVEELMPAQVGDFVKVIGPESVRIYYITQKEGGGLLTYNDAPALGKSKWINDYFEAYISRLVQEAEVVLHSDALKSLSN